MFRLYLLCYIIKLTTDKDESQIEKHLYANNYIKKETAALLSSFPLTLNTRTRAEV